MAQKADGMNYAPEGQKKAVVKPGEFVFAAIGLDHGHINGMCNGLTESGATLKWVYDPDPAKVAHFIKRYPDAKVAENADVIYNDSEVKLVASAAVPSDRCPIGIKAMESGKDYFVDKAPLISLEQLADAKKTVAKTGRIYSAYYSERLHVEAAYMADALIKEGKIGRVINMIGAGPHRIGGPRPDWFYTRANYGGILIDIGSHQIDQFLYFTGAKDAKLTSARIANYNNKDHPEFDDFGDASFVADNGATGYFRVDWFTPSGLGTWGDGRLIIVGTEGYIELRKYIDVARSPGGDNVYLVNGDGEQYFNARGIGCPFFGKLILDCLNRTDNAMNQEHMFKAAELCVLAQMNAIKVE